MPIFHTFTGNCSRIKRKSNRIENLRYSCSAIVIHWGLDKVYPQFSHHNVFLSDDYENNLHKIFHDPSISDHPSFYVHAPVRSDPTAAPAGQDSISIIIPSGHYSEQYDHNWNELKNNARVSVISRLKKLGMTDIEEHIKFEICYLPQTWKICSISQRALHLEVSVTIYFRWDISDHITGITSIRTYISPVAVHIPAAAYLSYYFQHSSLLNA